MAKKLPKIYQTSFTHKIDNNNKVFYSANKNNNRIVTENEKQDTRQNVDKTLNELFKTTGYIFNIPVEITTKERTLNTKIAGKVKNTIITLDNDVIPISSIISIKRKDRF